MAKRLSLLSRAKASRLPVMVCAATMACVAGLCPDAASAQKLKHSYSFRIARVQVDSAWVPLGPSKFNADGSESITFIAPPPRRGRCTVTVEHTTLTYQRPIATLEAGVKKSVEGEIVARHVFDGKKSGWKTENVNIFTSRPGAIFLTAMYLSRIDGQDFSIVESCVLFDSTVAEVDNMVAVSSYSDRM